LIFLLVLLLNVVQVKTILDRIIESKGQQRRTSSHYYFPSADAFSSASRSLRQIPKNFNKRPQLWFSSISSHDEPVGSSKANSLDRTESDFAALRTFLLPPLPDSPASLSHYKVEQMSVTDLASIGDVVYELLVRTYMVWPPKRTSDLQNQVVSLVRGVSVSCLVFSFYPHHVSHQVPFDDLPKAEYQSRLLSRLKESFVCTVAEQQILSRGRNSVKSGKKNRHTNPQAYQDATALECLIGYLYLTDSRRCSELLKWIRENLLSVE